MNVAVLGATGFIGSWATRALIAAGASVTGLARPTSDPWRLEGVPGFELVFSDDWASTLRELAPTAVLSLDWSGVSASHRNDETAQAANVPRQAALIDAALASGAQLFVGVGSQAEYGPVTDRVAEDQPLAPTSAYGRAKVAAGASLASTAEAAGARWVWARVFSVFGPLESGTWLLPSIAQSVASGDPMHMSSGAQPWSYLYAADAGTALAELVLNPQARGIYNVGHPVARPLRESVTTFAAALDGARTLVFGDRPGPHARPDMQRLESLGWSAETDVDSALATTARWLQGAPTPDPLLTGLVLPGVR